MREVQEQIYEWAVADPNKNTMEYVNCQSTMISYIEGREEIINSQIGANQATDSTRLNVGNGVLFEINQPVKSATVG